MWNIDIETRIRDLNTEAESRSARLLDTMTETDGSAIRQGVQLHLVDQLPRNRVAEEAPDGAAAVQRLPELRGREVGQRPVAHQHLGSTLELLAVDRDVSPVSQRSE